MKKFKHKITGIVAEKLNTCEKYKLKISTSDVIPAWVIENSNDWEEIIEKDYEILEYSYDTLDNTSVIYRIRRKSDGVEFKIGDRICGTSSIQEVKNTSNYKGYVIIKAIISTTDKRSKSGFKIEHCTGTSYWLEDLNLYKEPTLTTEDGYECTLDDRVFGVS